MERNQFQFGKRSNEHLHKHAPKKIIRQRLFNSNFIVLLRKILRHQIKRINDEFHKFHDRSIRRGNSRENNHSQTNEKKQHEIAHRILDILPKNLRRLRHNRAANQRSGRFLQTDGEQQQPRRQKQRDAVSLHFVQIHRRRDKNVDQRHQGIHLETNRSRTRQGHSRQAKRPEHEKKKNQQQNARKKQVNRTRTVPARRREQKNKRGHPKKPEKRKMARKKRSGRKNRKNPRRRAHENPAQRTQPNHRHFQIEVDRRKQKHRSTDNFVAGEIHRRPQRKFQTIRQTNRAESHPEPRRQDANSSRRRQQPSRQVGRKSRIRDHRRVRPAIPENRKRGYSNRNSQVL